MTYVFITFMHKLSPEQSKNILSELRKRIPGAQFIFSPKPPAGKKVVWSIDGQTVIITYPAQTRHQGQGQQGFTLGDVLKAKDKKA